MKIYFYLILLVLFIFFNECSSQKCISNKFLLDIPERFCDSGYKVSTDRVLSLLNLPNLEKGFDELQIRIWYGYPYSSIDNLILITKNSKDWHGEIWELNYKGNNHGIIDSIVCKKKKAVPRCGWNCFIDSLDNSQLFRLKDSKSLPGYEMTGEGQNIIVEIANCESYRIYSYVNPWLVVDQFEEAKRITFISGIIERQLSFSRLYRDTIQ